MWPNLESEASGHSGRWRAEGLGCGAAGVLAFLRLMAAIELVAVEVGEGGVGVGTGAVKVKEVEDWRQIGDSNSAEG